MKRFLPAVGPGLIGVLVLLRVAWLLPGILLPRSSGAAALPLPDDKPEPPSALAKPALAIVPPPPPPAEPPGAGRRHRVFGWISNVLRVMVGVYLVGLIVAITVEKGAFLKLVQLDPLLKAYGVFVSGYVISRFVVSAFYRPSPDAGIEPSVALVVPAFNEEDVIAATVEAVLAVDYPKDKLQLIIVND